MRWPVAICCAHAYQYQNFQNSFNLSGAKSVLVIPRQVTMHTSQNQLGLYQGPVTAYSTLQSYVAVTTSLAKQRVARLQLRGS